MIKYILLTESEQELQGNKVEQVYRNSAGRGVFINSYKTKTMILAMKWEEETEKIKWGNPRTSNNFLLF